VHAFDGLAIFSKGYGSNQAGILASSTAGAKLFMENHASVRLSLQGSSKTRPNAGRIVAPPTNHDAKVSLYPALGLDLNRTVLERNVPSVNATAGEHAAQTANASLRVRNFKPASLLGLWTRLLFWRGLCRLDLYLGIIRHTQIVSLAVFSAEIFVLLIRIAHTTKTNAKNCVIVEDY
jgi:hypothetical protein